MNRNTALLTLRDTVVFEEEKGMGLEKFQANTLRPILKFQNEVILTIFKHTFPEISELLILPDHKKYLSIGDFVRKNTTFRNIIKGMVLGQMTTDELSIFYNQEAEIGKRINALIIQRIADQIGQIS